MSQNVLKSGSELHPGDQLMAQNGQWKAIFQEDSNFVIYGWKPVWASDTWSLNGTRLRMQEDGNLVMYTDQGKVRWQTNTVRGGSSPGTLTLTDEGKLVLQKGGRELWNSGINKGIK